ncbi:hypothetical protein F3D15_18915 [Bacteroides ovatus]|nr:hypothetical protein F3D15_18915 [Bacteroides ovatus]
MWYVSCCIFVFFHGAKKRSGDETDALFVFDRASAGDKQSLRWEDSEALFGNEKNGHFAERFVERFFFSVNSCLNDCYLLFRKMW